MFLAARRFARQRQIASPKAGDTATAAPGSEATPLAGDPAQESPANDDDLDVPLGPRRSGPRESDRQCDLGSTPAVEIAAGSRFAGDKRNRPDQDQQRSSPGSVLDKDKKAKVSEKNNVKSEKKVEKEQGGKNGKETALSMASSSMASASHKKDGKQSIKKDTSKPESVSISSDSDDDVPLGPKRTPSSKSRESGRRCDLGPAAAAAGSRIAGDKRNRPDQDQQRSSPGSVLDKDKKAKVSEKNNVKSEKKVEKEQGGKNGKETALSMASSSMASASHKKDGKQSIQKGTSKPDSDSDDDVPLGPKRTPSSKSRESDRRCDLGPTPAAVAAGSRKSVAIASPTHKNKEAKSGTPAPAKAKTGAKADEAGSDAPTSTAASRAEDKQRRERSAPLSSYLRSTAMPASSTDAAHGGTRATGILFRALYAGAGKDQDQPQVEALAKAIEESLFARFGLNSEGYPGMVKTLRFNLDSNAQLRTNLLQGQIHPSQVPTMTSAQLASRDKAESKLKHFQAAAFQDSMFITAQNAGAVTADFTCEKCASTDCLFQHEHVLPDAFWTTTNEATQLIISCKGCGHEWRE